MGKLSLSCRRRRRQQLLRRCLHNKQGTAVAKLSEWGSEREETRAVNVCDEKNSNRKRNPFSLFFALTTASHCSFLHALDWLTGRLLHIFTPHPQNQKPPSQPPLAIRTMWGKISTTLTSIIIVNNKAHACCVTVIIPC